VLPKVKRETLTHCFIYGDPTTKLSANTSDKRMQGVIDVLLNIAANLRVSRRDAVYRFCVVMIF